MRMAFTIVLNGLHHLQHNDFAEKMLQNFDFWVVAEGAVHSKGSTSWCLQIPPNLHCNGASVDGTVQYLEQLAAEHDNLLYVPGNGFWPSKDVQVNAALQELKRKSQSGFLWQVDVDEQWTAEQLEQNEKQLLAAGAKTGLSHFHHFVGENLIAIGEWGGNNVPRLWQWSGELFRSHEPAELRGGNGKTTILDERFMHYSYYFEQDVCFKDEWYSGHKGIFARWRKLPLFREFPQPISKLIPGRWGRSRSYIVRFTEQYPNLADRLSS